MKAVLGLIVGLFIAGAASAADELATAQMQNRDGKALGKVTLTQTSQGVVLRVEMEGLPPGWHGIHIHGVGKCEPPFTTAGGHFNPGNQKHGFGKEGSHAGDLPNLYADATGHANAEFLDATVAIVEGGGAYLLGQDGTSIVVHAGLDDMMTDPAGNSGDRIACGVIKK